MVVALWRVWWRWQPAGWSGLWLAVPVAESVPPCQPAQRPPGPGEGVAVPPLHTGEKLRPGRHWSSSPVEDKWKKVKVMSGENFLEDAADKILVVGERSWDRS